MSSRVAAAVQAFGRVGETISGKYRILRGLGEGAAGCVYLAENVEIRRQVALKVLHPVLARSGEATGRFRREAQAAAAIRHPNIVDVLDMGRTDDGVPYFVMELLEGETLRALMDRRGALPVGQAVDIVQQMLFALSAAHAASIVHRDLKPSNVFLARQGGGTVVKVLDFGVAKYRHDAASPLGGADRTRLVVGTPNYMSPEQARGKAAIDGSSDLYSVGVLLFEMISACRPHDGATLDEILDSVATKEPLSLRTVAPAVPDELAAIVQLALERDPEKRFRKAEEFRAALAPFADTIELGDIDIPSSQAGDRPLSSVIEGQSESAHRDRSRAEPTLVVPRSRARRKWVLAVPVMVAAAILAAWALWGTAAAPATPARPAPLARTAVPSVPAHVTLAVDSSVPGARVFLDGRQVGATPVSTMVARAGPAVVRVEADGHVPAERRVDLSMPVELFVDLQASLSLSRPPAVSVDAAVRSAAAIGRAAPSSTGDRANEVVRPSARAGGTRGEAVPSAFSPGTRRRPMGPAGRSEPGSLIFDPFAP